VEATTETIKAQEAKVTMLVEMLEIANKFGDAERIDHLEWELRNARWAISVRCLKSGFGSCSE